MIKSSSNIAEYKDTTDKTRMVKKSQLIFHDYVRYIIWEKLFSVLPYSASLSREIIGLSVDSLRIPDGTLNSSS